ncbi:MAG: hypothetical protein UX13_C0024G0011 [Candidatus Woesebacteria bacterium GW2011_GWB1_45_5]|uniref:Uncharacterized protein n=1 Tax=Candidatus Woesebacteria bacterium GW2011_GWB1_45_5 TaxID=1618581 RepID=A0A0G1MP70_9BACT|nr:MAG: hypothetical protein UX13_C0024G0011 [Candidatus Woesebacteria bacterium GW2011_GWB1_45_5]
MHLEEEIDAENERQLKAVARSWLMQLWWYAQDLGANKLSELDIIVLSRIAEGPRVVSFEERKKMTESWTVGTLREDLHLTFEKIHGVIYKSLIPKGLVQIELGFQGTGRELGTKGSGKRKFIELTAFGKKMLTWADKVAGENLKENIQKLREGKKQ